MVRNYTRGEVFSLMSVRAAGNSHLTAFPASLSHIHTHTYIHARTCSLISRKSSGVKNKLLRRDTLELEAAVSRHSTDLSKQEM